MIESLYFQDYMPGNICFGCGTENTRGLQIKSFWQGDEAVCDWKPEQQHQGWPQLTCGGIIATLVDCHCMATAMAHAVRREHRTLDSEPQYRFATGNLNIRFLKPTPSIEAIQLRARVIDVKDERKYTLACDVFAAGVHTAKAEVIAFLVYRSDQPDVGSFAS